MNFIKGLYAKAINNVEAMKNDERGSQTLEWLGIAAVIVIIVGIISNAFDDSLGDTVKEKFEEFIDNIGG
ncbi:hypothetical protein SAMN04488072_103210 [Lentibacillus halodurans]|uniref:Uncharacterized protein n=1 Tax=Lentibacillus halodurans TaxID=237679 RepID=A0A1I0WQF2_9BACI|nr:hypothetical protein [Lentibacillus halodurans]SFA90999.1 hypothetical protein SAMN04488072_103210 [Lentibacillus halodurans]